MKSLLCLFLLLLLSKLACAQVRPTEREQKIKELVKHATAFEKNGDPVNAFNSNLAIFDIDTSSYIAANEMAKISGELHDYRTEIVWAKKAIAIKPDDATGYLYLGDAYAGQHDVILAGENYKVACKFNPHNPYPVYSLALLEDSKGNLKEATAYYAKVIALDDDFDIVNYKIAVDLAKLKEYAKAEDYIKKFLSSRYDFKDAQDLHKQIQDSLKKSFSFPSLPKSGKTINTFLVKGWTVKDEVTGDLNGDNLPDAAIVLEYNVFISEQRGKEETNEGHPRVLLILLKNNIGYSLALQHNTFILRDGEGGGMENDPYDKMEITKGVLNINFQFVRESLNYKVRYQTDDFYLIGASDYGHNMTGFDNWDFNFSTKKVIHISGGSPVNEKKTKTEWRTITGNSLKRLIELSKPYSWKVFKGISI